MLQRQSFRKLEKRLVGDALPATTAKTSARMARVRRAGTAPEMLVRRYLSGLGIRYRTKNRDLPGSPDLANRSKKWAVFVHGCFWHHHEGCKAATIPKTNKGFWRAKFAVNASRDARARALLEKKGFQVKTVWECQTHDFASTRKAVGRPFSPSSTRRGSQKR
jgi:DNA mismatch endonuclease, patch repair protein